MKLDKDVNEEKMSLDEFKEYCAEFDDNISDIIPKDRFEIRCKKCSSSNVQILFNGKVISQGSEFTGCWTSQDRNLVFKCIKCGNAISIKEDDF